MPFLHKTMPISYHIDLANKFISTTATGTVTDDDLAGLKDQLANDPHYEPTMRELSDFRNVERLSVTPDGVRNLARMDSRNGPETARHKLAIVVTKDIAFGMARMYQSLTDPEAGNVRVFRDIEGARSWLESTDG